MITATTPAKRGILATALVLAAAGWAASICHMNGMDMGTRTALGSFGSFVELWVPMMAAMMLPGAVPAVLRVAHGGGRVGRAAIFLGSYLSVWALVGVVVYALDRPHGTSAAGAVVLAAGVYELTPLKRHFRWRCRESWDSGCGFGASCVGSSIGLMAMMASIGVMSVTWMAVIAVLVLGQKLVGARAVIDIPLALAIVAFGVLITADPSLVPGLTSPM